MVRDLGNMTYEKRLKDLEKRSLADLIMSFKFMKDFYKEDGD